MDADTLRIILAVIGALVIAGLYLWERRRVRPDDDEVLEEQDPEVRKREPRLGAWTDDDPRQLELPQESDQPEFDLMPPAAPPLEFPPGPLILSLYVVSRGEPFDGAALVHAAGRFGLEPGEMEIFHCTLGEGVDSQTLFSMANMVRPGTFPFGAMDEFQSPGVTLFAQLDGTHDDPGRMEEMLGTAHSLAEELGGEIHDQTRRILTPDAERRLRERVMAFVGVRLAQSEPA